MCHVCQCFKLCILSLLMQVCATVMDFNKGNLLFYFVYYESVTINQSTTFTVLTNRQIRWSPNFSRTIDSDAIGNWGGGGKGLASPHCTEIWGGHPPSLPHSLFHPSVAREGNEPISAVAAKTSENIISVC